MTRQSERLAAGLPEALRRLRIEAGYETLRAAAKKTGVPLTNLSQWEAGRQKANGEALIIYLYELGYKLGALDRVLAAIDAEHQADDPATYVLGELRRRPDLLDQLRHVITETTDDPDNEPTRQLLEQLEHLEREHLEREPEQKPDEEEPAAGGQVQAEK